MFLCVVFDDSERSEEVCRVVRVWTRRRQGVLPATTFRVWCSLCLTKKFRRVITRRLRRRRRRRDRFLTYTQPPRPWIYTCKMCARVFVCACACVCVCVCVYLCIIVMMQWLDIQNDSPEAHWLRRRRQVRALQVHYNIAQSWTCV